MNAPSNDLWMMEKFNNKYKIGDSIIVHNQLRTGTLQTTVRELAFMAKGGVFFQIASGMIKNIEDVIGL